MGEGVARGRRCVPRGAGACGFTLLEAVLALGLLSAVVVVCLQLRTQALGARRDLAARAQHDRDVQAITAMITGGTLGRAASIDPDTKVRTWRGEHDGRSFTVAATPVKRPNPARPALGAAVAEEVRVWEYELAIDGRTTRFLWFR